MGQRWGVAHNWSSKMFQTASFLYLTVLSAHAQVPVQGEESLLHTNSKWEITPSHSQMKRWQPLSGQGIEECDWELLKSYTQGTVIGQQTLWQERMPQRWVRPVRPAFMGTPGAWGSRGKYKQRRQQTFAEKMTIWFFTHPLHQGAFLDSPVSSQHPLHTAPPHCIIITWVLICHTYFCPHRGTPRNKWKNDLLCSEWNSKVQLGQR